MKSAYDRGFNVFWKGYMDNSGINLKPNPYKTHTNGHREWERGFNAAYCKRLQRVIDNETRRRET